MESSHTKVMLYSIAHFLVDLACAYFLFSRVFSTDKWYLSVLLYNFFAFAVQMPAGLLADRWNRNAIFAALGCVLVAAAYGLWNSPVAAAVIAGTGNCMFHVGGGIDVLNLSGKRSGLLGVFVAPGALGLYIGTAYGKQGTDAAICILIALLLTAVMILLLQYASAHTFRSANEPVSFTAVGHAEVKQQINGPMEGNSPAASLENEEGGIQSGVLDRSGEIPFLAKKHLRILRPTVALAAVACFFIVVCLRSYVGLTLSFPWKGQGYWGILLVLAVVLGKMAGGIIADALGTLKATVISLGLAAVLFTFFHHPTAGVAAVFLFNMTMPITLCAVSRIFPGAKGFTFGLLTFGLFLGFVPVFLDLKHMFTNGIGFAAVSGVSLVILWLGLRLAGAHWTIPKQRVVSGTAGQKGKPC